MKEAPAIPDLPGLPETVGEPTLVLEEDGFRVFATELTIMWRWDIYNGDAHVHTGCAQHPESCVVAARSKIRFLRRPTVAMLLGGEGQ
ncbi:hypothetical protein [Thauera butanivorans]|uniref:Butane monooxygenase hypothetical assembly protein n=1 Tax=Thauera butanivorans TaxID=86174 RepID=Q8KH14_9RHOO|nr:hypothetical protein [Thauera butanivorans]AAM19731.1 butane monooxygenase hypothetical assembly protein [Thauera butanivorans]